MKILLATILSGFLGISVSAFAADSDYYQKQNKIIDNPNNTDLNLAPSQSGQQKNQGHSDKNSSHSKGHENEDIGMGSATEKGSSSSGSGSTGTGASGSSSSKN